MENIKHQSLFFFFFGCKSQKVLFQFLKENTVPIFTIFHNIWQFCCINRKEDSVIQLISSAEGKQCFPDTGRLTSFSKAE